MTHEVRLQRDGPHSRWSCPCGWATPWVLYTDPAAGAAAVRHTIEGA